jgi:hypothetical protein
MVGDPSVEAESSDPGTVSSPPDPEGVGAAPMSRPMHLGVGDRGDSSAGMGENESGQLLDPSPALGLGITLIPMHTGSSALHPTPASASGGPPSLPPLGLLPGAEGELGGLAKAVGASGAVSTGVGTGSAMATLPCSRARPRRDS